MHAHRERFNSSKIFPINFENFGLKDYTTALTMMQDFTAERDHNTSDQIWFMEHYPVFSCGIRTDGNDILNKENTPIVKTDRGGQVTYHGPGQLVGYPIISLNGYKKSITWFMHSLEQVIINTLKHFDIDSTRKDSLPGVWVEDEKICAMGVRIAQWVTMHGFALNIKPDMRYFDGMIPCGILDHGVTSIYDQLHPMVDNNKIINYLIQEFYKVFTV